MLSLVVYGRNDNHGYNLHKRVALSINCFSELLTHRDDEIIFVDYNTPDEHPSLIETIQDTLTEKARQLVRVIRAYPSVHKGYAGKTPFPVVEAIARNIGFRRTNPANKWVLSTNTDMILVPRNLNYSLNDILDTLEDGFYLLPRFELPEALWEQVDRSRPDDVIKKVRQWGKDFAINEVINRPLVRYDAPGDFQLALRRDLFALSGMDERMLLGNVHVDSNLCRRMELLRGELKTLVGELFGYHCAHTRTATMVHGRNKVSNDFERFVREVKDWRLLEQDSKWGEPQGEIEEVVLPRQGISKIERVLGKVISPMEIPFEEIHWGNDRRESFRYSVDHMLPYLASTLVPLPKKYSLGIVPSRPDVVVKVLRLWSELDFRGTIGIRREDLRRISEVCSLGDWPLAGRIVPCSDDEFFSNHEVFLFEFGLATESANVVRGDEAGELDNDMLSSVQEGLQKFILAERNRAFRCSPRRAIFVGVANNRFEPLVNDNFEVTHTPFTSRVRQGFLHRAPQAGPQAHFDPRELADAIRRTSQRRSVPPTDEVVRMWAELHELLQGAKASFPVTRGHLDLMEVAQTRGLLNLAQLDAKEAISSISKLRQSCGRRTRLGAGMLEDDDPPLYKLNKLADPRDWETREWWENIERFFGGSDAYSIYNRHRDVWLQGQIIYALRGAGLSSKSNVLVITEHSDDIYAVLSQLVGHVSVCRSAFGRPTPFDRTDLKRWLDVPVLGRPSRIKFLDQSLDDIPPGTFDFIVFARNSAQAQGAFGIIRAIERAQRCLVAGGVMIAALDVDVASGTHYERNISASNLAELLSEIGEKCGIVPVDVPDYRTPCQALDLCIDPDREMQKPHFIRERAGGITSAGIAVLRKRYEANIDSWREIKQSHLDWILGRMNRRIDLSDPFEIIDGSIRVEWGGPDGIIARVPQLSLPVGSYILPLSLRVDPHVPDDRTILGVEIEGPGDRALLVRDLTAFEARQGELTLPFIVNAHGDEDFPTITIRLRSFGRAGFDVSLGNIRPNDRGMRVLSKLDLKERNSLAPNAWRRGEEIIVERDAERRHFLFGPYQRLDTGWWRLRLDMSVTESSSQFEAVAELEILHGRAGRLPPGLELTPARCSQGPLTVDIFVPDAASEPAGFDGAFEFRIGFKGGGKILLHDFTLESISGPRLTDRWAFTLHDVVDSSIGSAMIWLPCDVWGFTTNSSDPGRIALVVDSSYIEGQFDGSDGVLWLDVGALPRDGWLRFDAEFSKGKPSFLLARSQKNPFVGNVSDQGSWMSVQGQGDEKKISNETEGRSSATDEEMSSQELVRSQASEFVHQAANPQSIVTAAVELMLDSEAEVDCERCDEGMNALASEQSLSAIGGGMSLSETDRIRASELPVHEDRQASIGDAAAGLLEIGPPVLFISAATLVGQSCIPFRRTRAIDPSFMLAGARSVGRAVEFVRHHRFEVARIAFSDIDYNMQPIPRARRILALKAWIELFSAVRSACKKVIVEVYQIEHRRQGPANTDILRRRLFAAADEIVLHDEGALKTLREFFPECISRVSVAAQWIASH
jgi:hypothetical protein